MPTDLYAEHALVIVDPQRAFDDPWWGPRNNPDCDANVLALVERWQTRPGPVVLVTHDSRDPDSPLHPTNPGNQLKSYVSQDVDLHVRKQVNSAFHGSPDLHAWLGAQGVTGIVICGFTTNHCCETTARVGGNLGYCTTLVLDATHSFDRLDLEGRTMRADELSRATATNLQGEFAVVVTTERVVTSGV